VPTPHNCYPCNAWGQGKGGSYVEKKADERIGVRNNGAVHVYKTKSWRGPERGGAGKAHLKTIREETAMAANANATASARGEAQLNNEKEKKKKKLARQGKKPRWPTGCFGKRMDYVSGRSRGYEAPPAIQMGDSTKGEHGQGLTDQWIRMKEAPRDWGAKKT